MAVGNAVLTCVKVLFFLLQKIHVYQVPVVRWLAVLTALIFHLSVAVATGSWSLQEETVCRLVSQISADFCSDCSYYLAVLSIYQFSSAEAVLELLLSATGLPGDCVEYMITGKGTAFYILS